MADARGEAVDEQLCLLLSLRLATAVYLTFASLLLLSHSTLTIRRRRYYTLFTL